MDNLIDEEFENIRSSWDNSSTKRVDQDPSLYYPTTDRIEDVEDDYSGGMSSPEMRYKIYFNVHVLQAWSCTFHFIFPLFY